MSTFYQVLDIPPSSTLAEIKASYRLLASVAHPDAGGDEDAITILNLAYGVLSDSEKRARYDNKLGVEMEQCASCAGSGVRFSHRNVRSHCPACRGVGYFPKKEGK